MGRWTSMDRWRERTETAAILISGLGNITKVKRSPKSCTGEGSIGAKASSPTIIIPGFTQAIST